MTIGSLFSGIGGFELGLEWAGLGPVKWQVECNPYALKILEKHWPDVKRYEKVEDCGKHNLEPVDLICGGFPCQDVSVAGKGKGLEGKQSGLWFEMLRIIRELRPRYVLVENVPGLRTKGRLEKVVASLARLGYSVEWTTLSAKEVGSPQLRKRVFIVAYPESKQSRRLQQPEFQADIDGCSQDVADSEEFPAGRLSQREEKKKSGLACSSQDMGDAQQSGLEGKRTQRSTTEPDSRAVESRLGRMAHGFSPWLDDPADSGKIPRVTTEVKDRNKRLECLGAAVVPEIVEIIGQWIIEFEAINL